MFLAKKGYQIVVIDNNSRVSPSFIPIKGVTYIDGDLKQENILNSVKKIDAVVHLASTVSVDECEDKPEISFYNNVISSYNIIKFCKDKKIKKLIFASTAALYLKDKNIYGISKETVEHLFKILNKKTSTTILRFFNVYGPGSHNKGNYSPVINKFLAQKKGRKPITVYKPGNQSRDFVHVNDICSLIYSILNTSKKYRLKNFDVCSGKTFKILDLAKLFSDKVSIIKSTRKEVISSKSKDPDKVRKYFKWKPREDLITYINSIL